MAKTIDDLKNKARRQAGSYRVEHNYTLPKLNNCIAIIDQKLANRSDRDESDVVKQKLIEMKARYEKARNVILNYYTAAKEISPATIIGQRNTLTVAKIIDRYGFHPTGLLKEQNMPKYNLADTVSDYRGLVLGTAAIAGGIAAANAITGKVAQKTLAEVIKEAIKNVWGTNAGKVVVIAGTVAGLSLLIAQVPKINRTIARAQQHQAEINASVNEVMNEATKDENSAYGMVNKNNGDHEWGEADFEALELNKEVKRKLYDLLGDPNSNLTEIQKANLLKNMRAYEAYEQKKMEEATEDEAAARESAKQARLEEEGKQKIIAKVNDLRANIDDASPENAAYKDKVIAGHKRETVDNLKAQKASNEKIQAEENLVSELDTNKNFILANNQDLTDDKKQAINNFIDAVAVRLKSLTTPVLDAAKVDSLLAEDDVKLEILKLSSFTVVANKTTFTIASNNLKDFVNNHETYLGLGSSVAALSDASDLTSTENCQFDEIEDMKSLDEQANLVGLAVNMDKTIVKKLVEGTALDPTETAAYNANKTTYNEYAKRLGFGDNFFENETAHQKNSKIDARVQAINNGTDAAFNTEAAQYYDKNKNDFEFISKLHPEMKDTLQELKDNGLTAAQLIKIIEEQNNREMATTESLLRS